MQFKTVDEAIEACEKAGYQPRDPVNGLGEQEYWIHLPRMERGICCLGDDAFLRWVNAHWRAMEIERIREAAGWSWELDECCPDGGGQWFSPCGISEEDWRSQGRLMPEEGPAISVTS